MDFIEEMACTRTCEDSMGLDSITYWPDVEWVDGPRNPQHVRDQWAGLRSRISLVQICNMLRQDVEAEPNLPEPEIIRAKNLLTSVEEILQKRGV